MQEPLAPNAAVLHESLGRGRVVVDQGETVVVRFESGISACPRHELAVLPDLAAPDEVRPAPPLRVLTRALALAIRSVNDTWGVFSNSRIDLLPHQLWVCRRVLERWPARWLVADDVGLGKTIEAGLILMPLLSSGRVRRLLVMVPASLVEQWQQRLREMFDIRLARYTTEADTPRSDFWGTHGLIVASAQTLRSDRNDRWKRLLDAPPWDLVFVDEAHHLNNNEKGGATLAWELLNELQERRKFTSLVFFTGTPHRGKDFGFLSLLKLLQPDKFDPKKPIEGQLGLLRDVMIRNNKRRVTDMRGKPLFQAVTVGSEDYHYNEAEAHFYAQLTEYIATGRAYASRLAAAEQRTAFLVLVAMQKLASSSVAAIRRALSGRLARLQDASRRVQHEAELKRELLELLDRDDPADSDRRAVLEEQLASHAYDLPLGPEEIPAIEELLAAAAAVEEETKVQRIVTLLDTRFAGRSVLLFTEYKATQALVMSALQARFGDGCVTFINGDGRLERIRRRDGTLEPQVIDRAEAARRFNQGEVPYLVSTEAAGEGIDLQRRCHTLIHIDLPWNPMRLHQRVGRIDRYGQTEAVEVLSLRNPDTVEARIWDCLNAKLDRVTRAFGAAMDDPEDMLQLVLGMSRGSEIEGIFAESAEAPPARLAEWFDARSATFGGERAIDVVRNLVGNVARFDFGTEKAGLPQVDLFDLLPFFRAVLTLAGRKFEDHDHSLSFRTPDEWVKADFAIAPRYQGLSFQRGKPGEDTRTDVAGVGHKVFDAALTFAIGQQEVMSIVPGLVRPLTLFAVRDAVTVGTSTVQTVLFGVEGDAGSPCLVHDWEIVQRLKEPASRPTALLRAPTDVAMALETSPQAHVARAGDWLRGCLKSIELPFKHPVLDPLLLMVPARTATDSVGPESSKVLRGISEQEQVGAAVREIWGAGSLADRLLARLLGAALEGDRAHLDFDDLADLVPDAAPDNVDDLALWFSRGDDPLLRFRFSFIGADAPTCDFDPQEVAGALRTGRLTHPLTGRTIDRFPEFLYPYFEITDRLRRMAGGGDR